MSEDPRVAVVAKALLEDAQARGYPYAVQVVKDKASEFIAMYDALRLQRRRLTTQKAETTGFEKSVASFYSSLVSKQEPLGKEFERVLHNNLWNLYVRS